MNKSHKYAIEVKGTKALLNQDRFLREYIQRLLVSIDFRGPH